MVIVPDTEGQLSCRIPHSWDLLLHLGFDFWSLRTIVETIELRPLLFWARESGNHTHPFPPSQSPVSGAAEGPGQVSCASSEHVMSSIGKTSPSSILALPGFASSSGVTLGRQNPRREKSWLEIKYSRRLVSRSHLSRANPRARPIPLSQVQWPVGTNETVDAGALEKLP